MLLLLLATAALRAACVLDSHDTVVKFAPDRVRRRDEWWYFVESGEIDCRRLFIPQETGQALRSLDVRILREQRSHSVGQERLRREPGGLDGGAGWWLLLPELRQGDRVRVDLDRESDRPRTHWVAGPAGWAALAVKGQDLVAWQRAGESWREVGLAAVRDAFWTAQDPAPPPEFVIARRGEPSPPDWEPPAVVAAGRMIEVSRTLRLDPDWGGRDGAGALFLTEVRTEVWGEGGGRVVGFPEDAVEPWCRMRRAGQPAEVEQRPDACVFRGQGEVELSYGWGLPGMPLFGEESLVEPVPVEHYALTIESGPLQLFVRASPGVARVHSDGVVKMRVDTVPPAAPDAQDPYRVAWRVARDPEGPVLTDRQAVIERVAFAALRASVPEPALPMDFKFRKRDEGLVDDLVDLLHQQVVPGWSAGVHPLLPRSLNTVRSTGWGTPWEMALVLARYLRQAKVDAVPVPLRPVTERVLDPVNPAGFHEAAVWLRDEDTWVAPTCRMCAVGELPASYQGAPAFSDVVDTLPAAPPAVRRREVRLEPRGDRWVGRVTETRTGHLALDLRTDLLDVPVEHRVEWLDRHVALGSALVAFTGIADRGAPVTFDHGEVSFDAPRLPWALPVVEPEGSPHVVLGGPVVWEDRVEVAWTYLPISTETMTATGLRWTREVGPAVEGRAVTERLEVLQPVVPRAEAVHFFARVAQWRGRLPEENKTPGGQP